MRANFIAFPISPRNSPMAVAHLINKVGVTHVFVGREQALIDLNNNAFTILKRSYPSIPLPGQSSMPLFDDLFLPPSEHVLSPQDIPYERTNPDSVIIIIHSSGLSLYCYQNTNNLDCRTGSTAFPKPIYMTNHRFNQVALIPWFGERDLTGQVLSLHAMPMYHGMGIIQACWVVSIEQLCFTSQCGTHIYV